MVGDHQVGQLVDDHVVAHPNRHLRQAVRQTDGAAGDGAGSVAPALVADIVQAFPAQLAVEVAPVEVLRPAFELSRRVELSTPLALFEALGHLVHPFRLFRPGHAGRDVDDEAPVLEAGRDGPGAARRAAHLDGHDQTLSALSRRR